MKKRLYPAMFLILFCTGCGSAPLQQETLPTEILQTDAPPETAASETLPELMPETVTETVPPAEAESDPALETASETAEVPVILLTDTDGNGTDYSFVYADETFQAQYTPDNWTICDSYRITDPAAMLAICEALHAEHRIHSADYESWRTPEDMVYEWEQHNLAYDMLADDSPWKASARDVDFDPADQGKSLYEIYQSRMQ